MPSVQVKTIFKQYVQDYLFVKYDFLKYDAYYRLKYEQGDDVDEHINFIHNGLLERHYESFNPKIDYDISNLFI